MNPCIVKTPLVVKVNNALLVNIGQGDGDTKWKGWAWKLPLIKYVIVYFYTSLCTYFSVSNNLLHEKFIMYNLPHIKQIQLNY